MSLEDLLLVPLGLVAGAYGAVIGAGGGFVVVPALLLIYGDRSAEEVTAVSLAVVLLSVLSATQAFARQRRIDYLTGVLFAAGTVPGAVAGVFAVRAVPRPGFDVMFGFLLLALAAVTWRGAASTAIREPLRGANVVRRTIITRDGDEYRYAYLRWQPPSLSVFIGFLASLFGVGGGVMQVPVMIAWMRVPAQIAVATSSFIVIFMSTTAVSLHLASGELSGDLGSEALVLGVSAVVGAQAGAALSRRFESVTIVRYLIGALGIVGVRLVLRAFV